jgi:hypothetical protein
MKGIKKITPDTDIKESIGTKIAENVAKMGTKPGKKLSYKGKKLAIKIK